MDKEKFNIAVSAVLTAVKGLEQGDAIAVLLTAAGETLEHHLIEALKNEPGSDGVTGYRHHVQGEINVALNAFPTEASILKYRPDILGLAPARPKNGIQ